MTTQHHPRESGEAISDEQMRIALLAGGLVCGAHNTRLIADAVRALTPPAAPSDDFYRQEYLRITGLLGPAWDYIQAHQDEFGIKLGEDKTPYVVKAFIESRTAPSDSASRPPVIDHMSDALLDAGITARFQRLCKVIGYPDPSDGRGVMEAGILFSAFGAMSAILEHGACPFTTEVAAPAPSVTAEAVATAAEMEMGIHALRHVIECLRATGTYSDEEGEATDFLEPLVEALGVITDQPVASEIDTLRETADRQSRKIGELIAENSRLAQRAGTGGDAKDAARYRNWRDLVTGAPRFTVMQTVVFQERLYAASNPLGFISTDKFDSEIDAAIDAAMDAKP